MVSYSFLYLLKDTKNKPYMTKWHDMRPTLAR